jgi:hypothetical protein
VAEIISAPGPEAAERLAAYWNALEQRVAGQRELASHLCARLSGREEVLAVPDVLVRNVPEQLVLVEQRHIPVDELPQWIGAAMARLVATAHAHGGVAGFPFVVYYGGVNEDSDGPAEACVPIADGSGSSDPPDLPDPPDAARPESIATHAMRLEPAHREAYMRLRKAQVAFPQILSAYDGGVRWASVNGIEINRSAARDLLQRFQIGHPRR